MECQLASIVWESFSKIVYSVETYFMYTHTTYMSSFLASYKVNFMYPDSVTAANLSH